MRKGERGKIKLTQRLLRRIFSFFIVHSSLLICSLFICSACHDPLTPSNPFTPPATIPSGKGSFSLAISVADMPRTILPDTPALGDFGLYRFVFAPTSGGQAHNGDRTFAQLSAPFYLVPGTYTVTLTAYRDDTLAARGSISGVLIEEGKSTEKMIELVTINDAGYGTFTYTVDFSGITNAIVWDTADMEMIPRDGQYNGEYVSFLPFGGDNDTMRTGTFSLEAGSYNIVFNFIKIDEDDNASVLVWRELLYVYAGLDSEYKWAFTDSQFSDPDYIVTFISNGGTAIPKGFVQHGGNVYKPTNPTYSSTGWVFEGWYTDPNFAGTVYGFNVPVYDDFTLYAKWRHIIPPLTDVNDIEPYLSTFPPNNYTNPVDLPMLLDLGVMTDSDSNWQKILNYLGSINNKYVNLDLSLCTIGGTSTVPGTVTEFNPVSNVATGKNRIVNITLPNVAISIPDGTGMESYSTFSYFTSLRSFSGAGLKTIGEWAFYGRTSLTQTSLPATITSIGTGAFSGCSNLALTSLPAGLTSIGSQAFQGCTSLTTITLPSNLTNIGTSAFSGCTNLTLVTSLGATPPTAGTDIFGATPPANLRIKVPSNSLAAYKTATNWVTYKERIFAGEGTTGDPFRIYDEGDLRRLVGQNIFSETWTLDAQYRMIANIALTSVWTPIGNFTSVTDNTPFTGSFDGAGYSISGLNISTVANYQGMFGYISGATVKNLALVSVSITSTAANIGGVAGFIKGSALVENCYVTGSVSGDTSVGGVVGENEEGTVKNCYVTADVTGSFVGGVVGSNSGTIKNCYATGNITANSNNYTGGVVGMYWIFDNNHTVSDCVALSPNITANSNFGRIIGYFGGSGTRANNYARNDMQKGGAYFAWTNKGANLNDGADITSDNYSLLSWWSGTAEFDFSSTGAWDWHATNNLPILKGFATGTQNPTVTPHTTASIKITVEQIKDEADEIAIASFIISKSGAAAEKTKTLTLTDPENTYDSIRWTIAGMGGGTTVTGTGATFIVNAENTNYNTIGGHTITLIVRIDGVPYSKIIEFEIVE
jgi:uncharacterized repeat protein (TIGR02543 family)